MPNSKLAMKLGLLGFGIGIVCMAVWFHVFSAAPFHLPVNYRSSAEIEASAPLWFRTFEFLANLVYALVPSIWLSRLFANAGNMTVVSIWILSVALNYPVYYCVGLLISGRPERLESQRANDGDSPVESQSTSSRKGE
jgi:hypothetical protein